MSRKSQSSLLSGTGRPVLGTLPSTDDDASLAVRLVLGTLIEARTRDAGMLAASPAVVRRTLTLIRRYRLRRLSLDHLIRALVALDQHVEIVGRAGDGELRAGIVVGVERDVESE